MTDEEIKNHRKEYQKKYFQENKEKLQKINKKWVDNNKEKIKEYKNNWYYKNKNSINKKDKTIEEKNNKREYMKKWREKNKLSLLKKKKEYNKMYNLKYPTYQKEYKLMNKEKLKIKEKSKIINDPIYAMKIRIRKQLSKIFHNKNIKKTKNSYEILSCSYEKFKEYIELQFEPWMNWENYGKYNGEFNFGWDIDHIVPLSSANTENDIIKLNHYTNLRPLCSHVNRDIKKDSLTCVYLSLLIMLIYPMTVVTLSLIS